MAQNIDLPPIDTKIVDENGFLTSNWRSWFSNFGSNLNTFMTQFGLKAPPITQAQINKLIKPENGTIFQNKTTGQPQIIVGGVVKTLEYK